MIIKLVVIRVLVVKMCDIGNSDGYYILSTYFKVDSGDGMIMTVTTKMVCDVGDNSVDGGDGDKDNNHARLFLSVVTPAYVYQRYVRVVFSHICYWA